MKVNCRFIGAFLASSLLLTSAAWAYIPPSDFLVRTLAHKRQGYKRIQVKTQVSQLDKTGQPTSLHFVEQTVYSRPATGVLKSWASDDHGQLLFATELNDRNFPAAAALLFESRSARLAEVLKAKGLPIETESELAALATEDDRHAAEKEGLARWNKTVAWVIGTQTPVEPANATKKPPVPQLWIEKDSFLPLRLIASFQEGDSALGDLQFDSYRFYNEFPYPRVVTWVMNGKDPYLRGDVVEASADAGPDLSKQALKEGWTPDGESAPGSLRDLINGYYRTFR